MSRLPLQSMAPWCSLIVLLDPVGTGARPLCQAVGEWALRLDDLGVIHDEVPPEPDDAGIRILQGLVYRRERPVHWLRTDARDIEHHLTLVLERNGILAVVATEHRVETRLQHWLDKDPRPSLHRVPDEVLNYAFLRGDALGLWLTNAQRRDPSRADSKMVAGPRVQNTLDPLDDGSFYCSSARARHVGDEHPGIDGSVQATPRRSSVALRQTTSWADFMLCVDGVFSLIESGMAAGGLDRPYEHLALPVHDLAGLTDAFEFAPTTPLELEMRTADDDVLAAAERLSHLELEIVRSNGKTFELALGNQSGTVGYVQCTPNLVPNGVLFEWSPVPAPGDAEALGVAVEDLREVGGRAFYGSGHQLSNEGVIEFRIPDQPYPHLTCHSFSPDWQIGCEKPGLGTLRDIEQSCGDGSDESLFSWVVQQWPDGWLICDDGTDEVADFVHLAPDGRLSLIHVKASSTNYCQRMISCVNFENVIAQATKNISFLDREVLANTLSVGARATSAACWHNGTRAPRIDAVAALRGSNHLGSRSLVIVQPHLRAAAVATVRADQEAGNMTVNVNRLRRLDLLLWRLQSTANSAGADCEVHIAD